LNWCTIYQYRHLPQEAVGVLCLFHWLLIEEGQFLDNERTAGRV
jgi:hypothetical protein